MGDRYDDLERMALQRTGGPAAAPAHGPIKVAQSQLIAHGYSPGHAPNGQLTPQTSKAVAQFQKAVALPPTGTLDAATQAALSDAPRPSTQGPSNPYQLQGGPIRVTRSGQASRGGDTVEYKSAGKRVPINFQSNGTVAATSSQDIPVTPQLAFRVEALTVDAATAANFSIVSIKIGVIPQNAGGSGNIPATIFPPTQTACVAFECDLADAGTVITLSVFNNDSAAHTFNGQLWGHEIMKAAA